MWLFVPNALKPQTLNPERPEELEAQREQLAPGNFALKQMADAQIQVRSAGVYGVLVRLDEAFRVYMVLVVAFFAFRVWASCRPLEPRNPKPYTVIDP